MNQSIQVLDGFRYITEKDAIKIDVMAAGQMMACYISGLDEENLISLYRTKQFEIEEIIEQDLSQEKFNVDGEIWLTAAEVYAY